MALNTTERDVDIFKDKDLSADAAREKLLALGELTQDRCLSIARSLVIVKDVSQTTAGGKKDKRQCLQANLWLKEPRQVKVNLSQAYPTFDVAAQHLIFEKLRQLELNDLNIAQAMESRPDAVRTRHQQLPEGKRPKTDTASVREPFERQSLHRLQQNVNKDAEGRAVPIDPTNQTTAASSTASDMVHGERVGLQGWVQYHAAGSQAIAVKVLLDTIVALGVQSLLYTALAAKVERAPLSEHAETCVYMISRLAACLAVLKYENGKEHMRERRTLLAGVAAEPHDGARQDPRGLRGRISRALGLHRGNEAVAEAEKRRAV